MLQFVLDPIVGALVVLGLPKVIPGIKVEDFKAALKLIFAIVTIRLLLRIFFWWILTPFKWLTLGLGTLIINTIILDVASDFISGVKIDSLKSAFQGSLALSVIWTLLSWALFS